MYFCMDKKLSRALLALLLLGCVATASVAGHIRTRSQTVAAVEWGLHFEQPASPPVPNLSDRQLNPYSAYYHGNTQEKVIYITFDAGYENGNTAPILDALKKHSAPAAFFLVGPYIENNPDLVKRMVSEGHTVGNHSYNHPDMTKKSQADFLSELSKTRQAFQKVTGQPMPMFYRPPEGKFTTENLQWAQAAGYTTLLWSSAYVDWNTSSQPDHSYAFEKIEERTFPGAVFLLHSTSQTNAEILDKQLSLWRQQGYTFGDVKDIAPSFSQQ